MAILHAAVRKRDFSAALQSGGQLRSPVNHRQEALAAVGNSYEITLIFIAFAFGCNIGCSVIVAQLFGAKEYRDMKTAVSTTMVLSAATCAVLMAIGLGLCTPLLTLIHTPENILAGLAALSAHLRARSSVRLFSIMLRRAFSAALG